MRRGRVRRCAILILILLPFQFKCCAFFQSRNLSKSSFSFSVNNRNRRPKDFTVESQILCELFSRVRTTQQQPPHHHLDYSLFNLMLSNLSRRDVFSGQNSSGWGSVGDWSKASGCQVWGRRFKAPSKRRSSVAATAVMEEPILRRVNLSWLFTALALAIINSSTCK